MSKATTVRVRDGCEVVAYDFDGEGEALLFVHATGFHAHMWLPVIRILRDRFHCYALDVRAHGASPPPVNGDFSWRTMGTDAHDVAVAFDIAPTRAVGHSAGGAQLLMAEQDYPGTCTAIWTYEPVVPNFPLAAEGGENPLAAGARRRRERFASRQAAYDNFATKEVFAAFDPEVLRLYVDHGFVDDPVEGGVVLACRGEDEARTYNGALGAGTFDRLPEVHVPVCVACGATSTHFPPARLAPVVERLPDAVLDPLPGLGHFGPFEAPDRIAASITAAFT